MAYYRASLQFALDSALPKDVVTINPHYQGDNPAALGDALKANLLANSGVGPSTPFRVKIYDAQKPAPSYPLYEVTSGTGFKVTTMPRELALCLSYYSSFNRPRFRGRMYIPTFFLGAGLPLRPTQAAIDNCLLWAGTLGRGLPNAHVWTVWSDMDKTGRTVTNAWCDDEWDIVRSRGLRGTTRSLTTVP